MKIEKIEVKHIEQIKEIVKEYNENQEDYNGAFFIKDVTNYEEKIKELENASNGILDNPTFVPYTCYIGLVNNKIVGVGSLRHYLNDYLKEFGGHIGYSIRPSERKKGYGTKMLELLKEEAKKMEIKELLITCYSDNFGSQKVITNNGGVFIGEVTDDNKITYKYIIKN